METVGDVILFLNPLYLVIGIVYIICLLLPYIHDKVNITNKESKLNTTRELAKHMSILGLSTLISLLLFLIFLLILVLVIVISKSDLEGLKPDILFISTKRIFNKLFWNYGVNAYAYTSIVWCFIIVMLMTIFYSLANKDYAQTLSFPKHNNNNEGSNVKQFHKYFCMIFFICFIFTIIIISMSIQKKIPVVFNINLCLLLVILIFGIASFDIKYLIIITFIFILIGYSLTITPHFVK